MASIDIFGKLVAGYTGPLTSADQVAYTETADGKTQSSVKDEIDALKQQGTGSAGNIAQIQADIENINNTLATKADQSSLDITNGNVTAAAEAAKAAQDTANKKVASVGAGSAITVDSSTATAPVVNIKLAETQGNVELNIANGLKASIDATEVATIAPVKGVAANDKFLTLGADKLISAVASLKYVKTAATGSDPAKYEIQLIGNNNQVVSTIDASDFIKDGMVESVNFDQTTKHLTITFNTDAGHDAINVDLTKLVDTYKSGTGLALAQDGTFSIDETVVATKKWATGAFDTKGAAAGVKTAVDAYTINGKALASASITLGGADITVGGESTQKGSTVAVAFKELEDKVATVEGKAGVTSIGGQAGAISVKNGQVNSGSINLSVSAEKELSATIVGLKSAAYTEASAYDKAGAAATVKSDLLGTSGSAGTTIWGLDQKIETNKTNANTALAGAKTELENKITSASADLQNQINTKAVQADWSQGTTTDPSYIKNKPDISGIADKQAAAAIKALGVQKVEAAAGQFITAVSASEGKLISVTSAAVKATQVTYGTDSNVGAALDSVKADVAAIKGTGTGSISSQIDAKINALNSEAANTASSAGTTATAQIKVAVSESAGKLSKVEVFAPKFALPSEVTSAVSTAKTELIGAAGTPDTIRHAESLANAAQTTANEAKTAAETASTTAASTYVKKAGDTMTGGLKMMAVDGGAGCTINWNSTDAALEFVFA